MVAANFPAIDRFGNNRHLISEVRYREKEDGFTRGEMSEFNYIICECGWEGATESFPAHRSQSAPRRIR